MVYEDKVDVIRQVMVKNRYHNENTDCSLTSEDFIDSQYKTKN